MIFFIPHASWEGRVSRTLLDDAFRSSHSDDDDGGGDFDFDFDFDMGWKSSTFGGASGDDFLTAIVVVVVVVVVFVVFPFSTIFLVPFFFDGVGLAAPAAPSSSS